MTEKTSFRIFGSDGERKATHHTLTRAKHNNITAVLGCFFLNLEELGHEFTEPFAFENALVMYFPAQGAP